MKGKQYEHSNGNVYTVIHVTNTKNITSKHPPDVVYMGQNGYVWSRRLEGWDRSFTLIE
jgi:hypothetical protein